MRDVVLVTGGAGYIGSHLVRKLLQRGYHVRVLDKFLYGEHGIAELRGDPNLELRYGDICNIRDVVSEPLILVSTLSARSSCRRMTRYLGLSGTKKRRTRKSTPGYVSEKNIHRQPRSCSQASLPMRAME